MHAAATVGCAHVEVTVSRTAVLGAALVVLAALLSQFLDPAMAVPALALEMQAAFVLAVAAGATLHVLFPQRTLNRLRRPARRHPASHKMQTRYIARRAVSAGFRRIAA